MNSKPVILLVDDNCATLQLVGELMENNGYDSVLATSGRQAFEYLARELPDLILLDTFLPEMDGYELCSQLQQDERYRQIPVVFLSTKNTPQDIVKGLNLGAVDYITKPFNTAELTLRVRNQLMLKKYRDEALNYSKRLEKAYKALQTSNETILKQNERQTELLDRLDKMVKTDYLTGLHNRRMMTEKIDAQINYFARYHKSFAVLLGDIDYFKSINDKYGHDAGDYVLKAIAEVFLCNIRRIDIASRWGGEEFLLLITEISEEGAKTIGERIRAAIEKEGIAYQNNTIHVTITIGIAIYTDVRQTRSELIKRADNALYIGKQNGRNQVVCR